VVATLSQGVRGPDWDTLPHSARIPKADALEGHKRTITWDPSP